MGPDSSQPSPQGQRTLAAIVFTDVVNFSGKMSVDEEHTLKLMQRDLELMSQFCQHFEGRVLKSTGDGLLMYFSSAVQAVACAQEIQNTISANAAQLPPADILQHRIGIHLGDVFVSATDVMGDGVNIAARLQSEAEPGGICISQIVYDVVKKRLALKATYLGPRELKHIQEAVPIYQIVLAAQSGNGDHSTKLHDLSIELPEEVPSDFSRSLPEPSQFVGLQNLSDDLRKQLEQLLAGAIGPIAPMLLKQALKAARSPQDLVDRLATYLPEQNRSRFREQASQLLKNLVEQPPDITPSPAEVVAPIPSQPASAINPDFIKSCELELAKSIGPIAPLIVRRTLSKQPNLSDAQLVESLIQHLPNAENASAFRQALLNN